MTFVFRIEKTYRGGNDKFVIAIDKQVFKDNFETEEELLEWIGEHTNGGHNYGYKVYSNRIYKIPKKYDCYTIDYQKIEKLLMTKQEKKK